MVFILLLQFKRYLKNNSLYLISKGTKDSINKAKKAGKEVIIVDVSEVIAKDKSELKKQAERREYLVNLAKK